LDGPAWLALSSGEALDGVLARLPPDAVQAMRRAQVIAASQRLAELAATRGFTRITRAADARPATLVRAMVDARRRPPADVSG
ncbi:MAG TPA: uroporphyrinogen-III synthase, partial [Luteimonas sp.]|nr:uroporphyrinogen-III synthase [Luteimonas sp.]